MELESGTGRFRVPKTPSQEKGLVNDAHCTKKRSYKSSKIVANVEKIPHLIKFSHICSKPKFMFERDLRKRQIW